MVTEMMLKSKSTTDIITQTDTSYIWNSLHGHDRTEMKTVESFEKHSILSLLPFCFTRIL